MTFVAAMPLITSPRPLLPTCPLSCQPFRSRPDKAFALKMCAATAISAGTEEDVYTWTGQDEFDKLNDRVDARPLPLPPIKSAKRVALVRHGQSTWNAQGRVQGSSNLSYLTKKGESQAETTQQLVGFQRAVICTESMVLSCGCSRAIAPMMHACKRQGCTDMFLE